jgi:hypothetical protein
MTPKEKALELYNKYEQLGRDFTRGVSMKEFAKQCTLIAVDEIINTNPKIIINWAFSGTQEFNNISYWQEVKKEIEKL